MMREDRTSKRRIEKEWKREVRKGYGEGNEGLRNRNQRATHDSIRRYRTRCSYIHTLLASCIEHLPLLFVTLLPFILAHCLHWSLVFVVPLHFAHIPGPLSVVIPGIDGH
ncbi:hypothetical protein F5Y07DRAFT_78795 [Xylaria sp. FL0933]|nr:hypothetical protein F5Y07DRAFT_78795 [Xylaria sp. FL0933]